MKIVTGSFSNYRIREMCLSCPKRCCSTCTHTVYMFHVRSYDKLKKVNSTNSTLLCTYCRSTSANTKNLWTAAVCGAHVRFHTDENFQKLLLWDRDVQMLVSEESNYQICEQKKCWICQWGQRLQVPCFTGRQWSLIRMRAWWCHYHAPLYICMTKRTPGPSAIFAIFIW